MSISVSSPVLSLTTALVALLALASCHTSPEYPHGHGEATNHSHELGEPVHVTTPAQRRLYEFHGHVGPYVVLGFRAGELAREILESPGYFDLTVVATCPLQTPKSCFLDGLQLGSGCTVGKRNLSFRAGEPIAALFRSKKSGESVRICLTAGLPERIRTWIEEAGVEETGEKAMALPRDEVFVVEQL